MYLLYSLLLTVGFVALLPKFILDAFRTRKYVTGLGERFGKLAFTADGTRPTLWLHCVSVGETEAARPLVRAIRKRFPSSRLVISTTTVTGQAIARKVFSNEADAIFYFPIDWLWTIRRVLSTLQPAAVLLMETEIWPNLLRECQTRAIPVALLNGRISSKSFGRYRLVRAFMGRVLNNLSTALMQSEADAERIRELGMSSERIHVLGNLKFDGVETIIDQGLLAEFRGRFGFDGVRPLIVAASTHAPEETIVLSSFGQLRKTQPELNPRLLIAPRHPERFDEVALLIKASGFSWARRTHPVSTGDKTCDVILLDSMGELRAAYAVADVAFVGGSIASHGGHNVLEPAALGVPIITGAHTQNFAAIIKTLLDERALLQLRNQEFAEVSAELASAIAELLSAESSCKAMAERALAVCRQNRGATERTMQAITVLLAGSERSPESIHFSALHAAVK